MTGGDTVTIDMTSGTTERRSGPPGTVRFTGLSDRVKDVEIWLPHHERTELVALRTDAPVAPVPDRGAPGLAAPRQFHQPGPQRHQPHRLGTGQVRFRATGDPAERASEKLTLGVTRDELARISTQRAAGDPNLHHLDGLDLYGRSDFADLPLPDQLHPDTATHRRIAERFAKRAFTADGPLADPSS
ncbi:hypothetical protein ACN26Y_18410 [Micromonospora sp. WMMD558]|uniref:hypothetical protein n=1 Tax=unclassified Micromonospora TaxID=2617518 RepID=UPI001E4B0506|nr:hypothetical protein [Micromonospora sp. WMMC415]